MGWLLPKYRHIIALFRTWNRLTELKTDRIVSEVGGGPRVVVSTAAFHARVRGSVPGLGGLKKQNCFFPIHV